MKTENKKFLIKVITITIGGVLSYAIGFFLNCFINNSSFDINLLNEYNTYLYAFEIFMVFVLIILILTLRHETLYTHRKIIEGRDNDRHIFSNLEQSRWQTLKEIRKNFTSVNYNELKYKNIEGIPLSAELKSKKLDITFVKPIHTLAIGTTGSGKTTNFINPMIQILSESKSKPCMLISDPKGELLEMHYNKLISSGYEVYVLDFRNPYNSTKWNPLERPFLNYQRMLKLESEISDEIDDEGKIIKLFNGIEYENEDVLNAALQLEKQKLYDEVYEDLHDIATVLCPIKSQNDPVWDSGAKNFILAVLLAMLEDSNEALGMTKEKYNFFNLTKIASHTDNDCKDLISYFTKRNPLSQCVTLSKQVLDGTDKTRLSYLSTAMDRLSMFSDKSICSLTSANEIDFLKLTDKPSALFLQIPDEKETRHPLASIAILQAYKEFVRKANTMPNLTLSRSIYFLLDEFGNLPKIEKLEQMITVGRSRHIWLVLVVQSYAQLYKVYGDKAAEIIKSNCNIQVFIGTTDQKTREEFSKLCGNYSVITRNVSTNSSKLNEINSSSSVKERPLIYPSELQLLNNDKNMGNAIISVFGYYPIKSKFTPSFKCPLYSLMKTKERSNTGRYFDEEKVFYDIGERNKKLGIEITEKAPSNTERQRMENHMPVHVIKLRVQKCLQNVCSNNEINELIKLMSVNKFKKVSELLENYLLRAREIKDFYAIEEIDELINELDYTPKIQTGKGESI